MLTIRRAARAIAAHIGPPAGLRILHVTDLHNRPGGLMLCRELTRQLLPDVVVNTGDLSGLGCIAETALIGLFGSVPAALVFAPGNHDSPAAAALYGALGACVMDRPVICTVGQIRLWGYPDPNRTRLLRGSDYEEARCAESAEIIVPPQREGPLVAAVHNELMVKPCPAVPVVLAGHYHHPKVFRTGPTLVVRTGSTGGGGVYPGPIHASVVEIQPGSYEPRAVWLAKCSGGETTVEPVRL